MIPMEMIKYYCDDPSIGKIETTKESYRLFISELFRKSDYNEKHPSD